MRANPYRRALLCALLPCLIARPAMAQAGPDSAPPTAGMSDADKCFALVKEGRALVKAGRAAEGIALIREGVALAERIHLPPADLAEILDDYGRYLHKAGDDEGSLEPLRRAAALAPKSAEIQLDLAMAAARVMEDEQAKEAAGRALALGVTGDDADDARTTIAEARRRILHERLQIGANVSIGFDSNIQQSATSQTIAGRNTQAAAKSQKPRVLREQDAMLRLDYQIPRLYKAAVQSDYLIAKPQVSQWGVPLALGFDVGGRIAGRRDAGLVLGYRFSQSLIVVAEQSDTLPDKDGYSFQEHDLMLSFALRRPRWLDARLRVEGFANFSGLIAFAPFQYGVNAGADVTLIESGRLRTRLSYTHNLRRAFDQQGDSQLNGNRDQAKVVQEIRAGWLRAQLGYQFTRDATGAISASLPFFIGADISAAPGGPCPETSAMEGVKAVLNCLGNFTYHAPLSNVDHQASLTLRFSLPGEVEINTAFRYDRQQYLGDYYTTYTGVSAAASYPTPPDPKTPTFPVVSPSTKPPLPVFEAGRVARDDDRFAADVRVSRDVGLGFSVELSYSFLYNRSTVANAIDNRNFVKHATGASVYWAF